MFRFTTKNQTSDHNRIIITLSRKRLLPHANLKTSSWSLIAIKDALHQNIILKTLIPPTCILLAIKNKRLILQDTGSTEYIANNNFNPLLLNNSPTNPKIETRYSIYLILNNV